MKNKRKNIFKTKVDKKDPERYQKKKIFVSSVEIFKIHFEIHAKNFCSNLSIFAKTGRFASIDVFHAFEEIDFCFQILFDSNYLVSDKNRLCIF